jgi:hypothetical protein
MSESKCLWDYVGRLWDSWYFVLISTTFGILGFVKDGLGWNVPLSPWFWWAAAFIALFISQFLAYRDLYRQYEAMLSPQANCTLAQVVKQIMEYEANSEQPMWGMSALIQLRDKALSDSISVWARAGRDIDPLQPVPADIWATHQIDYVAYLHDERGKLERTKGNTHADYIDFHFNHEQIATYWKPSFLKRPAIRARKLWRRRRQRAKEKAKP